MKHFHPGLRPVVVAALEAARHHIEHPAYEAGFDLHRQFYSPEQLMEAKAQAWEQGFERALEWHAWDGAPDDYKPSFANPYRVTH